MTAARIGDSELAGLLLKANSKIVDQRDRYGRTALFHVIEGLRLNFGIVHERTACDEAFHIFSK